MVPVTDESLFVSVLVSELQLDGGDSNCILRKEENMENILVNTGSFE